MGDNADNARGQSAVAAWLSARGLRAAVRVCCVVVAALAVVGVVLGAAVVGVAGLYTAGARQAALASAIRPPGAVSEAGLPLSRPQVMSSPLWQRPAWLGGGADDTAGADAATAGGEDRAAADGDTFGELTIRVDDIALPSGATGTATFSADTARWVDGQLHARNGTVTLELGADALGRPLGLRSAYLTASSDGSLASAPEDHARLSGRLRPTEPGPTEPGPTDPGPTEPVVAWTLHLAMDPATASATATLVGADTSRAGRNLARGTPVDPASPSSPAAPGTQLRFSATAMPLNLAPEHIFVQARTVTITARFTSVQFAPAELAAPRVFHTSLAP